MIVVGFTLGDIQGKEEELKSFLRKVTLMRDKDIERIISNPEEVNIFTTWTSLGELAKLPFNVTPITVAKGEYIIVTANYFVTEFYLGKFYRLSPTDFIRVTDGDLFKFHKLVALGVVKVLPYTDVREWPENPKVDTEGIFDITFSSTFN